MGSVEGWTFGATKAGIMEDTDAFCKSVDIPIEVAHSAFIHLDYLGLIVGS
jgi:hypothetical protein